MSDPSDKSSENKTANSLELSRRTFLKTTGTTVAATTVAPAVIGGAAARAQESGQETGTAIQLTVNGVLRQVTVQDHWTLVELLRDHLQLTGTKRLH